MEVFTRKTTDAVSAPQSANSCSQTTPSGWCSVQQTLHDTVWPDICIKHLRWCTSTTLQIAKPVNQSELSRDCVNTPNRLYIWDFRVVMMLSNALLCPFGFCINCWKDFDELQLWQATYFAVLWLCIITFAVVIHLQGLSNVYCCCYAWSIQNTHLILMKLLNMAKYLQPRPNACTQNFGAEATLALAVESNFAPYI